MLKSCIFTLLATLSFAYQTVDASDTRVARIKCRSILTMPEAEQTSATVTLELIRQYRSETNAVTRKAIKERVVLSHFTLFEREFARWCNMLTPEHREDCRNEIVLGVTKAFEKFDFEKNTIFYTYAYWCVRSQVTEYMDYLRQAGFMGYQSRLSREYGPKLRKELIRRAAFGLPVDVQSLARALDLPVDDVQELLDSRNVDVISTDASIYRNNELTFLEAFDSEENSSEEIWLENLDLKLFTDELAEFRKTLTKPRELDIFNSRILVEAGTEPEIRPVVASRLGVSVTRVQQIETSLLERLKKFLADRAGRRAR